MKRSEYTYRVLAAMRRVTAAERTAIQAELDAHIEDHMEALLDLGYEPKLAEQRTMERMGDPEEVGRELDKQYPLRWLVLYRISTALMVVVCIQCLWSLGFDFLSSVQARWGDPGVPNSRLENVNAMEVDIRVPVGNDVLRIYHIATGREQGETVARLNVCAYDRIPGGIVSSMLLNRMQLADQRGAVSESFGSDGYGTWGGLYGGGYVPVRPGDTYIQLTYDFMGEHMALQVPIPEVLP